MSIKYDKFGREITIDNFKHTSAYKKWRELNEKAAKDRKNKKFFSITGLKK